MTDAPRREHLSMTQQADLLDRILSRTVIREQGIAAETYLLLTKEEVEDLDHLVMRLRRIAPFETGIRRLVTGR